MKEQAKAVLSGATLRVLGRRNTVRLARFLLHQARYDMPNEACSNGENALQRSALTARPTGALVVLDVGANVGDWSRALISTCRDLQVEELVLHAFEPAPATARALEGNLSAVVHGYRVFVHELAASSSNGTALLHVPEPLAGTSSLVVRDASAPPSVADVTVRRVTLDSFCLEQGIESIFICKCDAEGHDLEVLLGASGLLKRGAISLFQFEYNWRWIAGRRFLRDAFELCEDVNYRLGKVTPKGVEFYERWSAELETFTEANYVLCRRDFSVRLPQVRWWNAPSASL